MEIILDDLWLCQDCLMIAVNDDASGMDDQTAARVRQGIASIEGDLVPNFDSETEEGIKDFSWSPCDCCRSKLGGSRHRFATLG